MQQITVSCRWLRAHLYDDDVVVLDASMNKVVGKEPIVYDKPLVIAGSQRCDLETELCDLTSNSTHAFPTPEQFSKVLSSLVIDDNSKVVVYDNQGIYSSPRAWWIFKTMGFEQVYILDGGLPQWIDEGGDTAESYRQPSPKASAVFTPTFLTKQLSSARDVLQTIGDDTALVVDARANERFTGKAPEPREGVRSGHIPQSINLPFAQVLSGNQFKNMTELKEVFDALVPQKTQTLVFSCGSGITACILLAAASISQYPNVSLYDGSWSEWGADEHFPIE